VIAGLLEMRDVEVVYGEATRAIRGISLSLPEGGCVALLGPNGAGKSTTARLATGLLKATGGRLAGGSVSYDGASIGGLDSADLVKAGISQVLEGRRIFADLSVEHNLRAGAYVRCSKSQLRGRIAEMYDLFPSLQRRRKVAGGNLSAASSRCWRSPGRSCRNPVYSSLTSRHWDSRRRSSSRYKASLPGFTPAESRSC
jgi:branched-chain amino acid transport system ATP-binding protein